MMRYYTPLGLYYQGRYAGRYLPTIAPGYSVEPAAPKPEGNDLIDLIGVPSAWLPRRESATTPQADLAMLSPGGLN